MFFVLGSYVRAENALLIGIFDALPWVPKTTVLFWCIYLITILENDTKKATRKKRSSGKTKVCNLFLVVKFTHTLLQGSNSHLELVIKLRSILWMKNTIIRSHADVTNFSRNLKIRHKVWLPYLFNVYDAYIISRACYHTYKCWWAKEGYLNVCLARKQNFTTTASWMWRDFYCAYVQMWFIGADSEFLVRTSSVLYRYLSGIFCNINLNSKKVRWSCGNSNTVDTRVVHCICRNEGVTYIRSFLIPGI